MNEIKISIVTIVYNGSDIIENTINSVINQTYTNIEYIIIDGGSKDGTQDIINKYEEKISYWKSEPDKGIYDAMNKGIAASTGDYIIFMNAGDRFYDINTIKDIFCKDNNNEDIIYGNTILDTDGVISLSAAKQFEKIKYGMPFCHQSVFVKLSLMKKDNFSLDYKLASDYNFFVALYKDKASFRKTDQLVAVYDNCGASMSLLTVKEKFIIAQKNYPFSGSSVFHFLQLKYYTFTAFLKRILPNSMVASLIKLKRKI